MRIILCRGLREGYPCLKDQLKVLKTHWEDDVSEDIKNMNVRNWKKVAQNRESWKKVGEQVKTLYRL
jgi:hypothetical protein